MTPEEIKLVKESWAKVLPISGQAAELFYGRLFELYPEVQPYFKGDMKEQGRKLMGMIGSAVNSLENLGTMIPVIKESGKRHAGYGVKDEDYDKVADALIWSLGKGLGDDFTDEVKSAWVTTYTSLADVMKEAAGESAAT